MQDRKCFAVVVALLVDRSLPVPEIYGSNPVISKFYNEIFTVNCGKDENKEKRGRDCPIFKGWKVLVQQRLLWLAEAVL